MRQERAAAALGSGGPRQDAEQRGLAGAVPADQPHARVVSGAKGEILEEGPRAEAVGHAVESDEDHLGFLPAPFGLSPSRRFIFSSFSFFSRSYQGKAMRRVRGLFSKIAVVAGPPLAPERATPEALQATVLALRGDWR